MLFTEPAFLFFFLPIVLGVYACLPRFLRNLWLFVVSLLFYYVGEQRWIVVMLASILFNYLLGLLFLTAEGVNRSAWRKCLLAFGLIGNLVPLAIFKYADFVLGSLHDALGMTFPFATAGKIGLHLPLGISFYTFHGMSYVIDIYRREFKPLKRPIDFGLYIVLFPQLIAGPIIRYSKIAAQFADRAVTTEGFAEGVRRFIIGLGKKTIIANTVAIRADQIFSLPVTEIDIKTAWLGAVCYAVQIYFDFSGYSDMAIGLGKMFGFTFPENFNYPYSATSVTDFWRRWHMTLSSWFRDYLYIPMGGNRVRPFRMYLNLLLVFFLCGLWHGASWTFVLWGLYHGVFLILERVAAKRVGLNLPRPIKHAYLILVVLIGWVIFRADDKSLAMGYLSTMFGFTSHVGTYTWRLLLTPDILIALILAVVGSVPWHSHILPGLVSRISSTPAKIVAWSLEFGFFLAILLISLLLCAASTYNPFLYFRF